MTTQLLFEEESGTSTGHRHPHNGYYAGDFTAHAKAPSSRPGSFTVVRTALHPSEQRAA